MEPGDSPDNGVITAADEVESGAGLPELKIEEIGRSVKPVVGFDEGGEIKTGQAVVLDYGDYTIVIGKGIDIIQILDKQGREVEDMDTNDLLIFDWGLICKEGDSLSRYVRLSMTRNAIFTSTKVVEDCPEEFRGFLAKYVDANSSKDGSCPIFGQKWKLNPTAVNRCVVSGDGGSVFFGETSSGFFVAFQTKTPEGVDLIPRNWIRFDSKDAYLGNLPPAILAEKTLLGVNKRVSNFYRAPNRDVCVYGDLLEVRGPYHGSVDIAFTDKITGVGTNLTHDPNNPNVIYYCKSNNPRAVVRLDLSEGPKTWHTEAADFPKKYESAANLQLDPTGNFLTFESNGEFVILTRDGLNEIKRIPKLCNVRLDKQGRIRGIDEKGHLVIYDANFKDITQELEKRRVTRLARGLTLDLFKKEAGQGAQSKVDQFQHLIPAKTDLETRFGEQLQTITALDGVSNISEALNRLRARLQSDGLQPAQVEFITQGIQDSIRGKERELAAPVVAQGLVDLSTKLAGNLTIATVTEAKGDLAKLRSLEGLVDDATRTRIRALESHFGQQSAELFRREGAVIEGDVNEMVGGVRSELEKMASMPDFADWQEFRLPQLVSRLGALANDCPIEASETQKKILAARRQLQELSREYETRFKEKYALVREKASEVMGERVELMRTDMDSLVDRFRSRGFKDRAQAETYIRSSEALEALRTEITELARQNPEVAKELDKELKVRLATVMSEAERGGLTSIAETGQQMVLFGDTLFPRWEGKVQETVQRHVDLVFIPDERTKGSGVSADQVFGDMGIMEINSRGKLERKRLYEGMQDEDEWRYGSVSYRGENVFPSYLSQAEYRRVKKDYGDWSKGDSSIIKQGLNEKRQLLHERYKERQKPGQRTPEIDAPWSAKYRELLGDYAKYAAEHHVLLFSRLDELRKAPETEFANGSGYVPEWQSHWTVDETTERYLEEMAQAFKMQLDLQEGILDLKGHAGTGKDVLLKIFCNRTNRPYFGFDCSKWTTEFELSEDVILESKEGASVTVRVPSVILNGIMTPGAMVYFNEYTAMPEQAQIFLHALTDEKRALTLKTSSGKTIRADKTVLLASSRNPGYPGTFEPQFATKSRMVSIQVDYPPLYREREPNDPNPNHPLSAAEALRVARQVDSLADLTYETNLQHNEFVKIWDRYVNGVANGAPDLNVVQKFDVEAILTMVEFAQKLREGFILKFEKRSAAEIKGKLVVDQPLTGREMRRMAYFLSKMSPEEKATANPEAVTRSLIERFFLSHIDSQKERDEIRTAMATWTSSKRPAA